HNNNVYVGDKVQIGSGNSFIVTQTKFDELRMKNSYKGTFSSDAKRTAFLLLKEQIGGPAFINENRLTMISLPNVTTIGLSAFKEATNLRYIDLPKVEQIGPEAFRHTAVRRISLPSLTSLD
ncbi:MAG: hypothetical protein DSZ21_00095, partial [Tenericutes bacterium]